MAADGVGVGGVTQVGADGLNGAAPRGSGEQNAPYVSGLAAVAIGREREMVAEHGHGIMQGTLVGRMSSRLCKRLSLGLQREPALEPDRQLVADLRPVVDRRRPRLRNIPRCQVQQLARGVSAR